MSTVQTIINKYGAPGPAYQLKYCEIWNAVKDFPWMANVLNEGTPDPKDHVTRILINKDFKAKLVQAFTNLQKENLHKEIETYGGCYNARSVRGYKTESLHGWAMAIDLNIEKEKLAQLGTHWSMRFIEIMKAAGLYWGGDWKSRKDSMHFALYNG
jgi:hypothetical protein